MLKVMYDQIMVEPVEAENTTASGVVVVTGTTDKTSSGVVVQLGEGRKTKSGLVLPFAVAKGDKVLYTTGCGHKVRIEGKEFVVLKEDDILGVLE